MKNANLLIPHQSFEWDDSDRNNAIEEFLNAFSEARNAGDFIYISEKIWDLDQYLYICTWQDAITNFPWLSQTHHQFITTQLFGYSNTKQNSNSLCELDSEFVDGNNGLFSISQHLSKDRNVYDVNTWHELHTNYLGSHPNDIVWVNNAYLPNYQYSNNFISDFVRKYKPELSDDGARLEYFEQHLIRDLRKTNKVDMINLAISILKANYYTIEIEITASEIKRCGGKERRIYSVNKNGVPQYLSIDHENFLLEVCDHNGTHCGAINFSGILKEKAKPDHSIIIQ